MRTANKILVVFLIACLLAGFVGVQSASAAVIDSFFFNFAGQYYYYIQVGPADTLISVTYQLCSGATGTLNLGVHTNGYTTPYQNEPIAWVTTTWVSNGTVTDYSGDCPSSSAAPPPNFYRDSFSDDDSGFAALAPPKNGSIYYDAGTCAVKCTIQPNLPASSAKSLPADATSTLYVRIAGEGGGYATCFDIGELTDPVIYRYVSGTWVSQPASVSGGMICTRASGDGAFALGGS